MNNLQYIVKGNTRFAMHAAVELCEQGDFDNVREAFEWLVHERETAKLTAEQVRECVETVYLEGYSDGSVNRGAHIEETDWQSIADELNAVLSGKRKSKEEGV